MCIRDRPISAPLSEVTQMPEIVETLVYRVDELKSRARERACLLYTSDAADERSSVDLGGRRIIKKKTKQRYVLADALYEQIYTQITQH